MQKNKKFSSYVEKYVKLTISKECEPEAWKRYKKAKMRNNAPNWVQKNIRYAASTHFRVFAKLYRIKKDGIRSISYAKKKINSEDVKNIE